MTHSHISFGAGVAGALLLMVPVLHMIFGSGAPRAADAVVGVFGVLLLALAATAAANPGGDRAKP